MKDFPYLTHDLGARNDPKLIELQMEMKGQGLAIFWCLVEMLWESGGSIPANYKSIAFALRWCKPSEVERVVNDFGLFSVEDGIITSRSATNRIEQYSSRINARKEAGRLGGMASRKENDEANVKQCSSKAQANVKQTLSNAEALLTNLLTKERKERTPLSAANIFEIFFFRNLKDPAGELNRFLEYYDGYGWKYQDGTPVDPEKAAEDWKPKLQGRRFNDEALRWYQAVWNAARTREKDAAENFLLQLDALRLNGQQLSITFKTANAGHTVGQFILDNDLAGDYRLDFRVAN